MYGADKILSGVGFDETLSGDPVLAEAIRLAQPSLDGLLINLRLVVERAEVERRPGVYDFAALDARMTRYRGLGSVRVYIDLRDALPALDALDGWGRFVRAVASRYRGAARGFVFGVRAAAPIPAPREYSFFLKTTAVNIRAGDDGAATIMAGVSGANVEWLAAVYLEDAAPYIDAIGLDAGEANPAILALVDQYDPNCDVVRLGEALGDDPATSGRRFLEHHLPTLGTRISGVSYAAPMPTIAAALGPISALRGMLSQELVPLDEKALGVRLTRAGEDVTATVRHQLLFGLESSTDYFIYSEPDQPFELQFTEPTGTRPTIEDALHGARLPTRAFNYDPAARIARLDLPNGSGPLVVDWSGADANYSTRENVASTRMPSVAEIISRSQQAQAVQDGLLSSYIAKANMQQHFRNTAIDSGFDVTTENRFFAEGKHAEWEELSFRLNGTKWGPNRPAFPLLQAEKVLSLPLDLRLNTDYHYRFVGVETIDSRSCFTLRFEPADEDRALYRGTVWIDRETYLKVKVQTIQTRLSTPVVSSEEIQYFSSAGTIADHQIQLLTRLVGRQIMLIAGRNLLVERGIRFDGFELNATDFAARREAARAGDNVMYRDTDEGLRYLVKRDGVRVIEAPTTTATAGLMGVIYDPSYDYPLPLIGVNYLNFNLMGKDNQLALVFGGVLALLNIQRPKLIGQHIDASLDLFAIAVKGNDRTYNDAGELTAQRLTTRPFSTGINVGWQMAEFQKLVASYQFRFDAYAVDPETSAAFRAPVSTATNGLGLSWEWKQGGFSFLAGGASYRRADWEPWGEPGDYRPSDQSYLKYSASLSRDYVFGLQKVHLNAAYYGGHDLDRFSAYAFGMFDDNHVHGVPSSGVRFGELGMIRGSYSFNLFDQYRFDVFVDQAVGRDPRLTTGWQALTGIGVGGNIRGPHNTLLRGDVGKSFLPPQYRQPGSLIVQFQVLKPL